ncbi:hypothetical protein PF005_g4406 [Phytophthora fragariae]|uniref:Protein kinase domain-containing protein n=1 Tax=Phytophthora fragariae TaxID=53985 RepID=A0A6A4A796_9STRA|nr:hypothetical protein PF010_g15405 [Phytophthora fragariae]KAE9130650.1 hypothetical protein PF007_g4439 [Phytophthora fragariae]KAE9136285.1 hypothetical protein PF006_g14423 [Phytophthora fragariae]KAE9218963.1 hypothetical protein PF004_g13732 [Phytophthora fragariae]KAE9228241.1 hypothetical protein PF005_g4406 [Phytophthora fragariae]
MEDLSLAETVELLTQTLLKKLRRRCEGPYAVFAGVVDRLRVLSKLLLEYQDLDTLVEGDEAIVNLLHQLNRSHLLRATDSSTDTESQRKNSHLQALLDAIARSRLAFVAHERIDDLVRVFLPQGEADLDWRTQWREDCDEQLQQFKMRLLQCEAEGMQPTERRGFLAKFRQYLGASSEESVVNDLSQKIVAMLEAREPEPEIERPQFQQSSIGGGPIEDAGISWQVDLVVLSPWQPRKRPQLTVGTLQTKEHKEYIPAHEIEFHTSWSSWHEKEDTSDSSSSSLFLGSWLDTTVAIQLAGDNSSDQDEVFDGGENGDTFDRQVCTWFRLDHPNVLKLFGGCDDTLHEIDTSHSPVPARAESTGLRFFVCEFAPTGTLRQLLDHHQQNGTSKSTRLLVTWTKLYETSLGLKYLHQRGIVHGRLRCREILVGNDGQAKLAVFGSKCNSKSSSDGRRKRDPLLRWTAPERLGIGPVSTYRAPPTMEADVFALGMVDLTTPTSRRLYR